MVAAAAAKPPDFRQRLVARAILQQLRDARPADEYRPHDRGQLQFHQSTHTIRGLFPGNGFGKTTAVAAEIDAWCRHTNRWQQTPRWPIVAVWFCPQYSQFGLLREQLETDIIGRNIAWRETRDGNFYEYPDGSRWYVASADRSWTFLQGINPDLVVFDEQPPIKLWREMKMRRRGRKKTRFIIAATATQGLTWMEGEVYTPWKEMHADLGFSVDTAVDEQLHPDIFCWPLGGIRDNPGADETDVQWYEKQEWSSEKEKKVRMHGGFEDWRGDTVFDDAAIEALRQEIEEWESLFPDFPLEGILQPVFPG